MLVSLSNKNLSSAIGICNKSGVLSSFLICSNDVWHSSLYWNLFFFLLYLVNWYDLLSEIIMEWWQKSPHHKMICNLDWFWWSWFDYCITVFSHWYVWWLSIFQHECKTQVWSLQNWHLWSEIFSPNFSNTCQIINVLFFSWENHSIINTDLIFFSNLDIFEHLVNELLPYCYWQT